MKILLIGAYGYTGKLICDEFEKFNILFSIAGRSEEKLKEVKNDYKNVQEYYTCDIRFIDDLSMFNQTDFYINCAGPFTEESSSFIELIANSGKKYIDISGEVGFIKNSKEKFHAKAIQTESLIIHGVAFESMLVDLILQGMPKQSKGQNINVFYQFNQKKVSPGTKMTMKLANNRDLLQIANGEWTFNDTEEKFQTFNLSNFSLSAIPYPLPEIAFAYWNYEPKEVKSFLLLPIDEAIYIQPFNRSQDDPKEILELLKTRKKNGPSKVERSLQKCEIIVSFGKMKWHLESTDMYQITAECIRILTLKLLGNVDFKGVLNPAQLFKEEEFEILNSLNVKINKGVEFESIL